MFSFESGFNSKTGVSKDCDTGCMAKEA